MACSKCKGYVHPRQRKCLSCGHDMGNDNK